MTADHQAQTSDHPTQTAVHRLLSGVARLSACFPLALLLICAAAYGPLLYCLGFYWDDWPSIWFLHAFGPGSFRQGFAADRPLLAGVFMLTTALVGESPLGWQVLGVTARWLAGLGLWATLRGVWPQRRRQAGAAAILFTLYPGFTQQYISVTYADAFLVFSLYLSSLAAMVWAFRKPRWKWPLLGFSFIAAGVSLFTTEYFAGLELVRPVVILLAADDKGRTTGHSLRSTIYRLRFALPYLALLAAFAIFRLGDKTPRAQVTLFSELRAAPAAAIGGLARTIAQDFGEANFTAWIHSLNPAALNNYDPSVLAWFALCVLASAALAGAWAWMNSAPLTPGPSPLRGEGGSPAHTPAAGADSPFPRGGGALPLILLGLYAFLASGWPVWITNLRLELFFPWDRLTLMTMAATALLLTGLLSLVGRWRWAWAALLALLVGLAAGAQFQYRLAYRQDWLAQQNFFWQLAWRIPGLQPGTLLLTSEIPFTYSTDNSLSAPLNWVYDPQAGTERASNRPAPMRALLYDIDARLGKGLPSLEPDTPVHEPYRAAVFDGNTSRAVVLFYDPPRCLKVIDPAIDRFLPVKPLYMREATPLSRLTQIETDPPVPAQPPAALFGPEPAPNWCYYFEKAELYNQRGDWRQAARLADQALKTNKHFTEKNVSELNPFIEAYAHTGDWQKALELTRSAAQTWDKMQYVLCDVWSRIQQTTADSPERQAALQAVQQQIDCRLP